MEIYPFSAHFLRLAACFNFFRFRLCGAGALPRLLMCLLMCSDSFKIPIGISHPLPNGTGGVADSTSCFILSSILDAFSNASIVSWGSSDKLERPKSIDMAMNNVSIV